MNTHIPVIIPAYEPDDQLLALCQELCRYDLTNIVLIDDGSGPASKPIFDKAEQEFHCTVVKHAVNLGKGRGLKNAFNACLNRDPELLGCVTADSDGQHTPADIIKCIEALKSHPDHLILGCRDFNQDNVPFNSKAGNKITHYICKWVAGVDVSDTQTGLRAIPASFMRDLMNVDGERFEFETNMLIASKDRYAITEVPIETVYDSKENHKTHFHPVKDSIRIYKIFGRMFLKFVFSSLSSCVIDLALFNLFCFVFKPYSAAWYITIATVFARIISATYNYLVNYSFVFQSSEKRSRSAVKYFSLAVIQMCLSAGLVTLVCFLLTNIKEVIIKAIIDVILFFISYRIQKELVFSGRKHKA
jgi:putative flippase GtrA